MVDSCLDLMMYTLDNVVFVFIKSTAEMAMFDVEGTIEEVDNLERI